MASTADETTECILIYCIAGISGSDQSPFLWAISTPVQADGSRQNNVLTSVPFLLITPQARSGAMGNAGVAVAADANAAAINMAAMAYLKEGSYGFSANYSPWLKNLTQE